MLIRTGFHVVLAAGGLIFTAAMITVAYNHTVVATAIMQNEAVDHIAVEGVQLVQLTHEFLLYGEPRAIEQWRIQCDEVAVLLQQQTILGNQSYQPQATHVASYVQDMRPLFERLVAKRTAQPKNEGDSVRVILTEQLFKKTSLLQQALRTLKTHADDQLKAVYAQNKGRLAFSFGLFAGVSGLFVLTVSFLFRRSVMEPIQSLGATISRIGQGNLAQRAAVVAADEIGAVCAAFNVLLDQQENSLREIEFLAFHDALTCLPNQIVVKDRLIQASAHADRSVSKIGVLFLDLDNFKAINDSLGHPVGDALLKEVAARLTHAVRAADTVSRQGGDEFLIMLTDIHDVDGIAGVAEKLLDQLSAPFQIEGHELSTSVSIGIAIYPDDSRDFANLLKQADTALYAAKGAGRNAYRFFTAQMNEAASEYQQMRVGLQHALVHGEFALFYQPQIDLASRAVIGAEALIRWRHPTRGLVPPGRFIPVAEDSGLIVDIGEWVLREACQQSVAWRQAGYSGLTIAVNLSAVQFKRGDIEQTIARALKHSGIDPEYLELELTESLLIQDTESVLATVRRLKAMGLKLSIDDFGTGYSSLSYLKRFKVDTLKIDQSFVRDLITDADDAAIVRAIIQMARSLNLRTLAEGVEDQQMLDWLTFHHCDVVQGYHFARPMPADEFERYLRVSVA